MFYQQGNLHFVFPDGTNGSDVVFATNAPGIRNVSVISADLPLKISSTRS
jgi:hypothetical protein